MAAVEELAKGGDVVADGSLGQRSFGTLSAGARREQRGAEPEQRHEAVHDDPRVCTLVAGGVRVPFPPPARYNMRWSFSEES